MARRDRNTNNPQEDNTMTETDDTFTVSDAETPAEPSTDGEKAKRKRDALPEGVGTPVDLANLLNKPMDEGGRAANVRPQQIYGYLRNDNAQFRTAVNARTHSDGRNILDLDAGLAWWDAKEQRKAERAAKAQAKADAAVEAPTQSE
jgi:hypothetical protein